MEVSSAQMEYVVETDEKSYSKASYLNFHLTAKKDYIFIYYLVDYNHSHHRQEKKGEKKGIKAEGKISNLCSHRR